MTDWADIIKNRSEPGLLIFDLQGRLLFTNLQASHALAGHPAILDEIRAHCTEIAASVSDTQTAPPSRLFFCAESDLVVHARAISAGDPLGGGGQCIVILIEKVVLKRRLDFRDIAARFGLSRRETQITELICNGLGNREISQRLFIAEQTVKDHTRKIMQKIGVNSRSALIAALY